MNITGVNRATIVLAGNIQKALKCSNIEAMNLALEVERNEILRRAFVLNEKDAHPNGLEAIAIALGYKP